MARVSRRFFLLSSIALSGGCAMRRPAVEATAAPNVRQPAVGQSWRYEKRDLYTRAIVDVQVDRVAAIDGRIEISSSNEAAGDASAEKTSWGTGLLRKYLGRHGTAGGPLPSEIQEPWGRVLVDAHWSQIQVFESPIPLWPSQLRAGWREHIKTKYKTPTNQDGLAWEQTMKALDWEMISVGAGEFTALRYTNEIKFTSADLGRADSVRHETLWFAPEIGRWVARESRGSFYAEDSAADQPYNESGYRWELLQWSAA